MAKVSLSSEIKFVKGVGPRRAEALTTVGVETVGDLLFYFPRTYLDRTNIVPIGKAKTGEMVTVIGKVRSHGVLHGKKKRYEVLLEDYSGQVMLVWFAGIRYWERYFQRDQIFAATGTMSYFMGAQLLHPELERLDDETDTLVHAGRIIPVYPQTAELTKVALTSRGLRSLTTFVLEHLEDSFPDFLPEDFRSGLHLPTLDFAVRHTHYPDTREQIEECRRRLACEELLALQFYVHRNKGKKASLKKSHSYQPPGDKITQLIAHLPYKLTDEQSKVTNEIFKDLQAPRPMTRLLHGDVGCGKTVVAVIAALHAAENNYQAALMAPTEMLAEQHFRNWHEPLEKVGCTSALLTSSFKPADKKRIAQQCADGSIDILFGTHALIYDYVSFAKLSLVIIDEQHRFGVEQRGQLFAKGDNPDLLVMTATPIPRSLALTLYGDLDISTIAKLPPGRAPVRSAWRTDESRPKVLQYLKDEVAKGGQAYMIFPLIDKSELQPEMRTTEQVFQELRSGLFKELRLGLVHGRIKAAERDKTLAAFRDKAIDVLLATTVIEVGIDNPNANLLVIEHAERFGLAQLHQLRGRVGRGSKGGTVVALAQEPIGDIARQRLEFFVSHNDGFEIAEADLNLRGPGELFGVRQSGAPELKMARYGTDRDLLEATRDLCERMFREFETLAPPYRRLFSFLSESAIKRDINLGGG